MLTCVPGSEDIVKSELLSYFSNIANIQIERGKVYFSTNLDYKLFFCLKCIDNIYAVIDRFRIGQHKEDLDDFYKKITRLNIKKILTSLNINCKRIIVSASRNGKHTYSRFEISDKAAEAMVKTYNFILGDEKNHDVAFRVDVNNDVCVFSLQISSSEFRFRGRDFTTSRGGIRPSVAHCLVRLSNPKNDDIFYDPFCGSGTIPYERMNYKYKKIFASDISPDVLNIAQTNLDDSVITFQSDACNTKMKNNSVDVVVTNLPWGKQINIDNLQDLYDCFFKELKRIMKNDGRALMLTNQDELIYTMGSKHLFTINKLVEFSLHGLHPSVYYLSNM